MEVQKTALYNYHKTLGAKFVPFAGYEMPIQYKEGIVKEHISTRSHAGFFDVSHMGQFFLEGDNTLVEALEKIIPADLKNLKINHSKYSFLLNKEGGIIDDLIITRTEKGFCIILNAACKENDIKQISQFLTKNHKHLLNNDLSLIALQGPKAVEILEKLIPEVSNLKFMTGDNFKFDNENLYITRSGYTGEDGFEISIKNEKAEIFVEKLLDALTLLLLLALILSFVPQEFAQLYALMAFLGVFGLIGLLLSMANGSINRILLGVLRLFPSRIQSIGAVWSGRLDLGLRSLSSPGRWLQALSLIHI